MKKRKLGRTEVEITQLGLGCAPLGDLFEALGEETAQQTLRAAWDGGIRYYDTAPFYGYGKSEHRVGTFLRQQPRNQFVLSTKVGRVFRKPDNLAAFDRGAWIGGLPFEFDYDYSYGGIMRSYEDSLQRLSLPSVNILLIHDLDSMFHESRAQFDAYMGQLITSGWRALDELRRTGEIQAVGAGINQLGMIPQFLAAFDLDLFIVAGAYNLLDQAMLENEFPLCAARGVEVIIGAVFASGILATGAVEGARFAYAPAADEILEKTRQIEGVCRQFNVPLPAASLQFLLSHPIVASLIPGAVAPEQVDQNIGLLNHPIPPDFWIVLKEQELLRIDAPIPGEKAVKSAIDSTLD